MREQHEVFLELIRIGIGRPVSCFSNEVDWNYIHQLAVEHGVTAVVLDSIEKLPETKGPNQMILLNWIGDVLHNYEKRYFQYRTAIADLARCYKAHGVKMMVLKGYACGINWPKPEHRPYGDIDIWLFGNQQYADDCLLEDKGIKVDKSEHHHTLFKWGEFLVENHYDFLNIHQHRSSVTMEKILKELGKDDSYFVEIDGEKVYLPSPNLHALFLLRHSMTHFAAEGINFRQLLDWAFFVEKNSKEVDWEWLKGVLEEFGMIPLFHIFNTICVDDLGFDAKLFPNVQFGHILKDKVLNEILNPKFSKELPNGFLKRVIYKYQRWKANEWKYRLCFKESVQMAFLSGVWNHLTKPKTI